MIYTSRNKGKVIADAIKKGFRLVWKSNEGIWHAAKNERNLPTHAIEHEFVDYLTTGKRN